MENFMRWFDREFDLGIPVWMFPNLLERLRGTPIRVENLIKSVPKPCIREKYNSQWSIQENIGHLADLEPLWKGRLEDFKEGKSELRPADLDNTLTNKANHNDSSLISILPLFHKLRSEMIEMFEKLTEEEKLKTALHPRLNKPMSVIDLMFFIAEHDDHHLAVISRNIKECERNND